MKILIKFPTRARADKFFSVLDSYIEKCDDINNVKFVISMDIDDPVMNNDNIKEKLKGYSKKVDITHHYGNNTTKVEAINSDMEKYQNWDILLLASDDMIPQEQGYDTIIRNHMKTHFPDTDGILWYDDGYTTKLNTLSIMGKKYYDRFNFIYHPSYKSLWCDNEYQDTFIYLAKYCHFERVIIKHIHPNWTGTGVDALLLKNEAHDPHDRQNYQERKKHNFYL